MAAKLTQIIYDEAQRDKCFPFAEIYFNEKLTIFFENEIIRKVVMESKEDKISVCSWKLKDKLRWYIGRPREITQELLESDYEVMSFTKNTENHKMLSAADLWHKGFLTTFDMMLAAIGVQRAWEVKIPIYQNHFSAKREIYQDYVKTYLIPAMHVLENDPWIHPLGMADSNYSTLERKDFSYLKDVIGVPWVPLVPFLLERLFSVYVQNRGIRVTHL